jgi:uncharacterized damage-inducible protein DinB
MRTTGRLAGAKEDLMETRLPWFERKFVFDLPHEKAPEIVERLRGTPLRIEERLASIGSDLYTLRVGDAWSIQENVGHLLDLEPLWFGRVDDLEEGRETLRAADLENRKTHEANHNGARMDELVRRLRAERKRLVDRLDAMDVDRFSRAARHPRLDQPMRLVDLCLFVADHDDCHLARITQLHRALS